MSLRAHYQNNISEFLKDDQDRILGVLTDAHGFSLEPQQKAAWIAQINNLQEQLTPFRKGKVFFEFSIPRIGKRIDVVVFIDNVVFALEYKVGSEKHERHAKEQVFDYALDLKNFHDGSHEKRIVPLLVSTKSEKIINKIDWYKDGVAVPLLSNGQDLHQIIADVLESFDPVISNKKINYGMADSFQDDFEADRWANSNYKPTPTIIEAAQALYRDHSVDEISRSDAGAKNLTHTSNSIREIIKFSKENRKKSICFITGVPGSGKTLAGLNISTQTFDDNSREHAVFLSGNGPLVEVLKEALVRDKVARQKKRGNKISKKDAMREVSKFIQNIHHFRDAGLHSAEAPDEHVVIFDEAQRAWDQPHAENFMIRKGKARSFDMSEPEFLIGYMDRKDDWCVIICLIGGGQEINSGEAGLIEWVNALLAERFSGWEVYTSDHLSHRIYNCGEDLDKKLSQLNRKIKGELHLSVSIRSFRAERLSDFVGHVIDGEASAAKRIFLQLDNYPLVLTRDINQARAWLKNKARGSEREGLVASSGALRLKSEGVHVKSKIDPINWF